MSKDILAQLLIFGSVLAIGVSMLIYARYIRHKKEAV